MKGINGDIAFIKQGPAGKESAQNVPSVYLVKIDGGKVDEAVAAPCRPERREAIVIPALVPGIQLLASCSGRQRHDGSRQQVPG